MDVSVIKSMRVLVVGGTKQWQSVIRAEAPRFVFVPVDKLNFCLRVINTVDAIVLRADYISHAQSKRICQKAKALGRRIIYGHQNKELFFNDLLAAI